MCNFIKHFYEALSPTILCPKHSYKLILKNTAFATMAEKNYDNYGLNNPIC